MTQTINNRFHAMLLERIALKRDSVFEELEYGGAVTDFATYRERVGYLRALKELPEWCDEIETKLNKG